MLSSAGYYLFQLILVVSLLADINGENWLQTPKAISFDKSNIYIIDITKLSPNWRINWFHIFKTKANRYPEERALLKPYCLSLIRLLNPRYFILLYIILQLVVSITLFLFWSRKLVPKKFCEKLENYSTLEQVLLVFNRNAGFCGW